MSEIVVNLKSFSPPRIGTSFLGVGGGFKSVVWRIDPVNFDGREITILKITQEDDHKELKKITGIASPSQAGGREVKIKFDDKEYELGGLISRNELTIKKINSISKIKRSSFPKSH